MSCASSPPRRVEFKPTSTDPDNTVPPRANRYSGTFSSRTPTWGGPSVVKVRSQLPHDAISATTSAHVHARPSKTRPRLVSPSRARTTSAPVLKASGGNGLQLERLIARGRGDPTDQAGVMGRAPVDGLVRARWEPTLPDEQRAPSGG